MTLIEMLSTQADEIIKDALSGVERSQLPPHKSSTTDQVRQRVKALFVLTARAIKERNLGPMLAHAESVGRERSAAGVDLTEVQIAFNVLEEVLWHRIVTHVPPAYYGEAFGLVETVLSAGKDMLARTYITMAGKTKVDSLNLKQLFDGSESP